MIRNTHIPKLLNYVFHAALIAGVVFSLCCFVLHAWHVLTFPHPLDYGEGPLASQVQLLQQGMSLWDLYGDPATPPYAIVNYPPLYLLLASLLTRLIGDVLLAGRFISLLATLGSVGALFFLGRRHHSSSSKTAFPPLLVWGSLLFLTIPIVQEWGVLMRVDMLGVCLGLWSMVALQRRWSWLAGIFMVLTLYTKPSLIAAPLGGYLWFGITAFRARRAGFQNHAKKIQASAWRVVAVLVGVGGSLFLLLQWATDGWFAHHIITANANRWEGSLARAFWGEQVMLRWPLGVAAGLTLWWRITHMRLRSVEEGFDILLPILYTTVGMLTAIGVGKVGAYPNYFLELYAGLVWMVCLALASEQFAEVKARANEDLPWKWGTTFLLVASLVSYAPWWNPNNLYRAGTIEPRTPELVFGEYPVWEDLLRERDVLAARHRILEQLAQKVDDAEIILTDTPAIAVDARVPSRIQPFEYRQLLDQKKWDEDQLLIELANGTIPLAVVEYLGNWLSPNVVTMLSHRYAQENSYGIYDLYMPVQPGTLIPIEHLFGERLRLYGYRLGSTWGGNGAGNIVAAGDMLMVTTEWQWVGKRKHSGTDGPSLSLSLRLTDRVGHPLVETRLPLVYGALSVYDFPDEGYVQHIQTLTIPSNLPPRTYGIELLVQRDGENIAPPKEIARMTVIATGDPNTPTGYRFPETNYFVTPPFLDAWRNIGGVERAGYPITPAVPFAWGTLQCFERVCFEMREGSIYQRPIGEQLYAAQTDRSITCEPTMADTQPRTFNGTVCRSFSDIWQRYGEENLGQAISGEITLRQPFTAQQPVVVQWTRNARLERILGADEQQLGLIGRESLRLSPSERYLWPTKP
jgi:hypothetical protein